MKKWLLLVLVAICWSCNKNTYEINGIFTTEDGTEIYLIDLERNDTLDIVETKDNKFHFSGDLEEPFYAYVGYAKRESVLYWNKALLRWILMNGWHMVPLL